MQTIVLKTEFRVALLTLGFKSGVRNEYAMGVQRGTNSWGGSGVLVTDVVYDTTGNDSDACSFRMAINHQHKQPVYVRVNIYGGNVSVCRMKGLKNGDYVVIEGALMNREGRGDTLTEIRCKDIVITK